jgi:hypothetical protein
MPNRQHSIDRSNGDDFYENPIDNLDEYQKKELKSFMKKLEEENSGKQS